MTNVDVKEEVTGARLQATAATGVAAVTSGLKGTAMWNSGYEENITDSTVCESRRRERE